MCGAEHGETVSLCAIAVDPPTRWQETRGDRIGSLKEKSPKMTNVGALLPAGGPCENGR
jgi:hypothetical protein